MFARANCARVAVAAASAKTVLRAIRTLVSRWCVLTPHPSRCFCGQSTPPPGETMNVAPVESIGFRLLRRSALLFAALCCSASAAFAKPTRIFLHPSSDVIVAGGHAFGSGGAYEKVRGTVEFQIDPADPRNANITDLSLAPRDADGLVSFDADYMLLYPQDLRNWNRQLVSEINNRGSLLLFLSFANSPLNNAPTTQAD